MSAANGIATPAATNATMPCWWNLRGDERGREPAREQDHRHAHRDGEDRRDDRARANERTRPPGLAATDQDRHEADVRHVHPEPRGRARDERELRGQGHDPEERGPQPARHDHLGGERGEHAGRQADHVLPGAAEDVPLVAEASSWQDRVDRRSEPTLGARGAERGVGRHRQALDLGLGDRVELGVGACVLRRGGRALWSVLVVGHASPVSDGEPGPHAEEGMVRRRATVIARSLEGRLGASKDGRPKGRRRRPRGSRAPQEVGRCGMSQSFEATMTSFGLRGVFVVAGELVPGRSPRRRPRRAPRRAGARGPRSGAGGPPPGPGAGAPGPPARRRRRARRRERPRRGPRDPGAGSASPRRTRSACRARPRP